MTKLRSGLDEHHAKKPGQSLTDYLPLLVLLKVSALGAAAMESHRKEWGVHSWANDFMGLFFLMFAMLKLFDLEGFADGFQKYDLLGKRWRLYAYTFPFIELALGLGYLSRWQPTVINWLTVAVLSFGALGIVNAMRKGLDVNCTCMGNILRVPLSSVSLLEDVGMAAMAAGLLWTQG